MRHPRYEWPIQNLYSTLTLASVGVHKHAWGYPNLDPEDGIEAFNICQIYEGQVCLSISFTLSVIKRLIKSTLAIGSVPIHTNSCPRMY